MLFLSSDQTHAEHGNTTLYGILQIVEKNVRINYWSRYTGISFELGQDQHFGRVHIYTQSVFGNPPQKKYNITQNEFITIFHLVCMTPLNNRINTAKQIHMCSVISSDNQIKNFMLKISIFHERKLSIICIRN